jgi:aldehyde dehydrogenase (NAD+)
MTVPRTSRKSGTGSRARNRAHAYAGPSRIPELIFGDLWEFDPSPERADPRIKPEYGLFIGGEFVEPASGRSFESINPATFKTVSRIALRR